MGNEFNQPNNQNLNAQKPEKQGFAHKTGDQIERLGEKISNAGAEKLGKVVYDAGNKIEHMGDKNRR